MSEDPSPRDIPQIPLPTDWRPPADLVGEATRLVTEAVPTAEEDRTRIASPYLDLVNDLDAKDFFKPTPPADAMPGDIFIDGNDAWVVTGKGLAMRVGPASYTVARPDRGSASHDRDRGIFLVALRQHGWVEVVVEGGANVEHWLDVAASLIEQGMVVLREATKTSRIYVAGPELSE